MEIKIVVKKLAFVNHQIPNANKNYKLITNYGVSFARLANNIFETNLQVSIKQTEDNPFPFDISAEIALLSKFDLSEMNRKSVESYLRFNSINILFPYLRSTVTNLSSTAMVGQIVPPLVNVNEFAKRADLTNILKGIE